MELIRLFREDAMKFKGLVFLQWLRFKAQGVVDCIGKEVDMSAEEGDSISSDESAISDRIEGKLKAVVICWFLGIGAALAWNTMLYISNYYYVGSPAVQHYPLRVLTLVHEAVALGTMMLLAYYEAKLHTRYQIFLGYFFSCTCLIYTIMAELFAGATFGVGMASAKNYRGFCVLVGLQGVFDALAQGGFIGNLSLMDPTFLQSFLAGLATSGALTSLLKLAVFDKNHSGVRTGTVFLFLFISGVYQGVCILLHRGMLIKIPIVKHYHKKAALEGSKTVLSDLYAVGIPNTLYYNVQDVGVAQDPDRLSKKTLIYQNLDIVLDLCLISGLTFFIFPGFLFKSTAHTNQLSSWYGVVLVALYNIFDVIGRCVPMRLESRKGLMVACLSRLLLIPCFYFTATYGGRGWMILLVAFLGLTNGYLTVCALTVAPKGYRAPEQNALGNLLFVFFLGGAFSGVVLDYLWLVGVL